MIGIGAEIRVVPVGVGKIQSDSQISLSTGCAKLLDNIAAERCLHDRICQFAILQRWPPCRVPANPLLDEGAGVEHREALVMFCCEGKHPHTVVGEKRCPFVRVKAGRVPVFVNFVVVGAFGIAQIEKGPRLMRKSGSGI